MSQNKCAKSGDIFSPHRLSGTYTAKGYRLQGCDLKNSTM